MAILCPDISSSIQRNVEASSVAFGSAMADGELWLFGANTACWIKQGAGVLASAGDGSMFVPGGADRILDGSAGPDLAVIQDAAGGRATLTRMLRR